MSMELEIGAKKVDLLLPMEGGRRVRVRVEKGENEWKRN